MMAFSKRQPLQQGYTMLKNPEEAAEEAEGLLSRNFSGTKDFGPLIDKSKRKETNFGFAASFQPNLPSSIDGGGTSTGSFQGQLEQVELRSRGSGTKLQTMTEWALPIETNGNGCVERKILPGDTLQKIALQYH